MDEVLLTPAGIADALGKLLPLDQDMLYNCHKVSQAQHAKTKRELVEWLYGHCIEHRIFSKRMFCFKCQLALRREVR